MFLLAVWILQPNPTQEGFSRIIIIISAPNSYGKVIAPLFYESVVYQRIDWQGKRKICWLFLFFLLIYCGKKWQNLATGGVGLVPI